MEKTQRQWIDPSKELPSENVIVEVVTQEGKRDYMIFIDTISSWYLGTGDIVKPCLEGPKAWSPLVAKPDWWAQEEDDIAHPEWSLRSNPPPFHQLVKVVEDGGTSGWYRLDEDFNWYRMEGDPLEKVVIYGPASHAVAAWTSMLEIPPYWIKDKTISEDFSPTYFLYPHEEIVWTE